MSGAVIIGAGPAGLTAAYELSRLGMRSTILGADNQVGGLSRTVNHQGYRFDLGGHRFFTKVPLIRQLWHEILGDEFLLRSRRSSIYYRGRFFDYPFKAVNALVGLGPVEASLVCLSYAKARLLPSREETTFEQWVSNRFGQRLYRIFFKTYTEKVWGIPCTEISADWAAQRIKNLSLAGTVRNALGGNGMGRQGQAITTLIDQFHYPRLGPGMMWERCEALLAGRGSQTLRGIRIERIRHCRRRVTCVEGRDESGEVVEFGGDHFISSMPVGELIHALDPAPPDDVLRAANRLRYRDYLTVVLIVNRESVFPDNWLYIHSPEVTVGRIQNFKNWSPGMVPDPSRTSLGLEYFLWNTDERWAWPDERLIELGIRECAQVGLIEPNEVEDGCVVRMEKAYPIYDRSYRENLSTLRRYLEGFSNLQTIGRNGLHRYNNQDHSMLTGVFAARNLHGARHDIWAVNTEREYHEEDRAAASRTGPRRAPIRAASVTVGAHLSEDELVDAAFAPLDALALGTAVGLVGSLTLFLATAVLLLKGGAVIGPKLSLLGRYFLRYDVTWTGALIGLFEGAVVGFLLGYVGAKLRNWAMAAYAALLKRRMAARQRRDLPDRGQEWQT